MKINEDYQIKQKLIQLLTLVNGGITFAYIGLIVYAITRLIGVIV